MAFPEDFLKQLQATRDKLWPTCKNCHAQLGLERKPGDPCPICGTDIPEPST